MSLVGGPGWQDHVVFSVDNRGERSSIEQLPFADRCLPETGISSFGMISNLVRWYVLTPSHGGLHERGQRRACSDVLKAVIDIVGYDGSEFKFVVVLTKAWECTWPRPAMPVDGESVVQLILTGRTLDISAIVKAACMQSRSSQAAVISKALSSTLGDATTIDLQA